MEGESYHQVCSVVYQVVVGFSATPDVYESLADAEARAEIEKERQHPAADMKPGDGWIRSDRSDRGIGNGNPILVTWGFRDSLAASPYAKRGLVAPCTGFCIQIMEIRLWPRPRRNAAPRGCE